MGAVGEGRWGALWGIVGMIVGAALYAEAFPFLKQTVLTWGDLGKITLPQVLGVNHWVVIPVIIAGTLGCFTGLKKGACNAEAWARNPAASGWGEKFFVGGKPGSPRCKLSLAPMGEPLLPQSSPQKVFSGFTGAPQANEENSYEKIQFLIEMKPMKRISY
jgi:hypothetical protein